MEPTVRPARREDGAVVAPLLYSSAGNMYDRFAGDRRRAFRLLRRAFESEGTNASAEVVAVAEDDGRVVAAIAAFPVSETASRSSAFLRLSLRTIPPWRWLATLRFWRAGGRATPSPPDTALYVDALATDPAFRRRGAARALLDHAEAEARRLRLPAVALDTSMENRPARALYLGAGYQEAAYRAPMRGLPGVVALVKELE